jgi:hypothetical protein
VSTALTKSCFIIVQKLLFLISKRDGTYSLFIRIMLFCDHVTMEFSGQDRPEFKGVKSGRLYLTTHRMIFNNQNHKDPLVSFSFPFCTMKDVSLISYNYYLPLNVLKLCYCPFFLLG